MRDTRGQTAAEYMGVMLLVSLIIVALVTSSPAAKIAAGMQHAVCVIIGGECEPAPQDPAQPPGTGTPGDEGGDPPQGPPLDGGPIVALPFPGSVTVSCTYNAKQPETCIPKGQPGVGVTASGELKIERTPTTLDANGCPWQNLSVGTTLKLNANAAAKNPKASGSLSAYLGQSTTYQVTVNPDSADQIADGDRPPPNPVDPTTIQAGESVQLTEDFYTGINAKGSYRALQVEMGYDEGTRVSSGVKRISPTTVRVMVGDSEFVRQALKLGVGYKDLSVAIGNTKDLADGNLHAVDIDISNQAGWDAYQAFLSSGALPKQGTPGTLNPTTAETLVYTDVTKLEAKLGGLTLGGRLNTSDGRLTVTHNADGTVDTVGTARYGDVGVAVARKEDASGDQVGEPTRSLLLHDVDSSLIDGLYQVTGQPAPSDLGSDIRLDLTEAQLGRLREAALQNLADKVAMNGKRPTTQEIADSLADKDGVVEFDGVEYAFGGLDTFLGEAQTPDEMLLALYHGGMSSGAVAENLMMLMLNHELKLPVINSPSC